MKYAKGSLPVKPLALSLLKLLLIHRPHGAFSSIHPHKALMKAEVVTDCVLLTVLVSRKKKLCNIQLETETNRKKVFLCLNDGGMILIWHCCHLVHIAKPTRKPRHWSTCISTYSVMMYCDIHSQATLLRTAPHSCNYPTSLSCGNSTVHKIKSFRVRSHQISLTVGEPHCDGGPPV